MLDEVVRVWGFESWLEKGGYVWILGFVVRIRDQ